MQAKSQTIKAREMCGEEEYDSENSALGDEVDDTREMQRLSLVSDSNLVELDPQVAQGISVTTSKREGDQEAETKNHSKAERIARKKAKRKTDKKSQEAQEKSVEVSARMPDDTAQDEIAVPPTNKLSNHKPGTEAHQDLRMSQEPHPHKKRKPATSGQIPEQSGPNKKKRKSNEDAKSSNPSVSRKSDFRSPMIQ